MPKPEDVSIYPEIKEWLFTSKSKHRAVDDAVAQGLMFMKIRAFSSTGSTVES